MELSVCREHGQATFWALQWFSILCHVFDANLFSGFEGLFFHYVNEVDRAMQLAAVATMLVLAWWRHQ